MTFSKLNYAIASLLLVGASSLLVSCASTNDVPDSQPKAGEELTVVIPTDCPLVNPKPTVIRKETTSEGESKRPEKASTEPDANCITVSYNGS